MIRNWLTLFSFAVLASLSSAQTEKEAVSAFEKAFSKRSNASLEERLAVTGGLAGHDSKKVAEALVEVFSEVAEQRADVERQRVEKNDELTELLAGKEFDRTRVLPQAQHQRFQELRREIAALRDALDGLRSLEDALLEALGRLEGEESLDYLIAKVIGDKRVPFSFKRVVAQRAAARGESVLPGMIKALSRARRAEEIVVVLDGIARLGKRAREAAEEVLDVLDHEDPTVRERAAEALSMIAVKEAVLPLVERVERETGLTQKRIAIALEVLTRQKIGLSPKAWRHWWEQEKERVLAGQVELGGGESTLRAKAEGHGYYYGIPQEGSSLVYVIDCSGSMVVSLEDPQFRDGQPVAASDPAQSRMEACKRELAKAISELRDGTRFGIVAYNDVPFVFRDKLLVATDATRKEAVQWVSTLDASQTTNIHDALGRAFRFAGRGIQDRYYGVEVDTLFLLTDGSPTKSDGSPDSTQKVIDAVSRWNPHRRVTVHCIGVGKGINAPFLESLAKENGGRYVQK